MKVKLFPTYVRTYVHIYFSPPLPSLPLPLSPLPLPLVIFFSVQVWDSFGRNLYSSQLHESPIASLAWSPDGVCACACVYVCMYVHASTYMYILYVSVCLYVCVSMCLCLYVCTYVGVYVLYTRYPPMHDMEYNHTIPKQLGLTYRNAPNTTAHLVFLNCCL